MIRETIIPTENTYTMQLPNEWIGKELSVEIKENITKPNGAYQNKYEGLSKEERDKKIDAFFDKFNIEVSKVTPYKREELYDR